MATSNIPFHPAFPYLMPEGATNSAVAVASDGTVVLVVQVVKGGITAKCEFLCAVGTCANGMITFPTALAEFFHFTGNASGIDVAIDDHGRVVFVFTDTANLWYVTGTLGANHAIAWNGGLKFDTGDTPSVAISNNGTILEAHRSTNDNGAVFHHLGLWNGSVIEGFAEKGKQVVELKIGSLDSVSAAINDAGHAVVGYSGGVLSMPAASFITGTVQSGAVQWHSLGARDFDEGEHCELHVDANGNVVATYNQVGGFTSPLIRYRTGAITSDGTSIQLDDAGTYDVEVDMLTSSLSPTGNYLVLLFDAEGAGMLMYADLT